MNASCTYSGCDKYVAPKKKILRAIGTITTVNNRTRRLCFHHLLVFYLLLCKALVTAYVYSGQSVKTTKTTSRFSRLSTLGSPRSTSFALHESTAVSLNDKQPQDNRYNGEGLKPPSSVEELLRIYAYGERIIKLDFDDSDGHLIGQRIVRNPGREDEHSFVVKTEGGIFAEVQDGGNSNMCRILGIITKASEKSKKKKASKAKDGETENNQNSIRPPRLKVAFVETSAGNGTTADAKATTKTIDVGQVTTIWTASDDGDFKEKLSTLSSPIAAICEKVLQILPVNYVEDVFENRYKYHVGRGRNIHGGGALTKKQVEMISAAASVAASSSISTFDQTEELRRIIDLVLKQCLRCGSKYTRLLDSTSLEKWMFYDEVEGTITHDYTSGSDTTLQERKIFCATALAEDSETAGRFKRMACLWLPPPSPDNDKEKAQSSLASTTTLTLVNGGWVVVDQSVRAAAEGRRFAASVTSLGGRLTNDSNDERILCRLESLACGEKLQQQKRGGGVGIRLEVDVRTTLEAMDLPLSSEGAQEALIRMGRWTKKESSGGEGKGKVPYERWSPSVLDATKWYDQMDRLRRRNMKSKLLEMRAKEQTQKSRKKTKETPSPAVLEGRVDLTKLPCICVDAERTSFRDDAFGIRKRSSTGRKVNDKASQWELLFHIADVSDIYAPHPMLVDSPYASGTSRGQETTAKVSVAEQKKHLKELAKAAQSRIRSEYNLPLGPLHLLPTTVLDSLSLHVFKQDWTSNPNTWPNSWHTMDQKNGAVNRAVTLWVYIDERSGYVMDIGFERSIISRPLALTFETATKLLEASEEQQEKLPPILAKARVLLGVVERNIEVWSDKRQKKSNEARAREEKLAAREFISDQVFGGRNNRRRRRDDGRDGDFRRNRGHRLVDSTLHLYENAFRMMMQRRKAMVPQHPLASGNKYGGMRSATAPLRYYLQGLAQRQALAVLCDYGGPPIPNEECKKIGSTITSAYNARRNSGGATNGPQVAPPQQLAAVRSLKSHLKKHSSLKNRVVPAISTGTNSEVVIQGVGAVAFCKEIPGTLKPGVKVMVRILQVDDKNGKVVVALDSKN
eukprot:CAMPEP_0197178424 /NCGR_PEP_ID=MMETSP1423-20130617/3704_1 /TAXON_ID=476441 /ORGANISM="Pseudo-nitzschia heimii, Strain UNC1101" /LENGTH=1078 /DNA_ID=CAMNT_0042628161 /DNA_START=158 /DNA_END=3394 /DNA_ORIENTATION=-